MTEEYEQLRRDAEMLRPIAEADSSVFIEPPTLLEAAMARLVLALWDEWQWRDALARPVPDHIIEARDAAIDEYRNSPEQSGEGQP